MPRRSAPRDPPAFRRRHRKVSCNRSSLEPSTPATNNRMPRPRAVASEHRGSKRPSLAVRLDDSASSHPSLSRQSLRPQSESNRKDFERFRQELISARTRSNWTQRVGPESHIRRLSYPPLSTCQEFIGHFFNSRKNPQRGPRFPTGPGGFSPAAERLSRGCLRRPPAPARAGEGTNRARPAGCGSRRRAVRGSPDPARRRPKRLQRQGDLRSRFEQVGRPAPSAPTRPNW